MQRFLIFLTLGLLTVSIACSKKNDGAESIFQKGISALESAKFAEAKSIFGSIDSLYPASLLGKLGSIYALNLERFDVDAVNEYAKILKENEDYAPAIKALAELALKTGRINIAAAMAKKYSEIGGAKDTARALELETMLKLGNYKEAESILNGGLSAGIKFPRFLWLGARYYLYSGNQKEQVRLATEAIKAGNIGFDDYLSAGDYFSARGLIDSAAIYYELAFSNGYDGYYSKADIAERLIQNGYINSAKKYIEKMKAQADSTHRICLLESQLYNRQGKPSYALYAYESGASKYTNYCSVLMNYSRLRLKTNDFAGADTYLLMALECLQDKNGIGEEISGLMLEGAEGYLNNDLIPSAAPILDKAYELIPNDYRLLYDYAMMMIDNPSDTVRELIRTLHNASIDNPIRLTQLGQLFLSADSLDMAADYFNRTLKLDRVSWPAAIGMVSIYIKKAQIDKAIDFLNGVDENLARYPEIAKAKIDLYERKSDYSSALRIAIDNIKSAPKDFGRYRIAFELSRKLNDKNKAEEICRNCVDINSDTPEAFMLFAEFYQWNNQISLQEEYAAKALAIDPLFSPALLFFAARDTLKGDINSTLAKYKDILQIDPNNANAINNVALLMLKRGDNPWAVVNQAQGAVALDPRNPLIYSTIGQGYYAMGKFANARASFENALKFGPDNPEINYHAGLNYIKDNKPGLAKTHLRKALSLGLSGNLKNTAEAELRKL
jgi:tetratricopeptide (TPR) repeat protein